jgi:hypothetical protein
MSDSMPSCNEQNRDLRFLLAVTGDVAGAAEVATMEQKTEAAIARCWHEEDGFFYGVDTRTSVMIRKPGIAGLLPLFADAALTARRGVRDWCGAWRTGWLGSLMACRASSRGGRSSSRSAIGAARCG